jgi:hypothetical protein
MIVDADSVLLSHMQTTLAANPEAKQREIATGMGLSLGMTNAVLKRFAGKGWVMAKRISSRNIRYALTAEGMNEIAHRSYRYMRRTFAEVRECRAAVEQRIMQAKVQGCTRVCLYGESDIAFIVEWACRRAGLAFVQMQVPETWTALPDGVLGIVSECAGETAEDTLKALGCMSVYEVAEKK